MKGKIALVQRGSCRFDEKALRAQQAGAIAVVIYNNYAASINTNGGYGGSSVVNGTEITVPVVLIDQKHGEALLKATEEAATVSISLHCNSTSVHYTPPPRDKVLFHKAGTWKLRRSHQIGTVSLPNDYSLSFEITPSSGLTYGWSNILHLTARGDCCSYGDRIPAIWFFSYSRRLYLIDGHSRHGNDECPIRTQLRFNQTTVVLIEMRPSVVDVYFNGTKMCTEFRSDRRVFRAVQVYASDPWYVSAKAAVGNLAIKTTAAGLNSVMTIGKDCFDSCIAKGYSAQDCKEKHCRTAPSPSPPPPPSPGTVDCSRWKDCTPNNPCVKSGGNCAPKLSNGKCAAGTKPCNFSAVQWKCDTSKNSVSKLRYRQEMVGTQEQP